MGIAEELTILNNTKANIKTAIENKGQDLSGVNFAGYAAKIDAIVTGGGGSESTVNEWTEAYWQSELTKAQNNIIEYIRDPEWLSIPTLLESDTKFVGLHAIPQGESFLALKAAGNYTVDWGDGIIENFNANVIAYHSYDYDLVDITNTTLTSKGYKQVIVQVYPQDGQLFTLIDINLKHNKANLQKYSTGFLDINIAGINLSTVTISGTTQNIYHNMLKSFSLNTNSITNASYMFYNCTGLINVSFNTSNVTSMNYMFYNCTNLETIYLPNTGNVTDMSYMFYNCYNLITIPLLDTTKVTTMTGMFHYCYMLTTIPLLNTSNVTSMNYMFYNCIKLITIPLINTSKVVNMNKIFYYCTNLKTIPTFDTCIVTDMSYMFFACTTLIYVPLFNTINVIDMSYMFVSCFGLTAIPLLDTINVSNMYQMFQNCTNLTTIPLLNTINVANMNYMFQNCYNLTTIPLLNTINVNNMTFMFQSCKALISIPLLNTSNVTSMSNMFSMCVVMETIPLLNTINVKDMTNMFQGCSSLTSIPLLNTINVTNMSGMFYGCYALISIPLLNTINVVAMGNMFYECYVLKTIPLLNTGNVKYMNNMFYKCYNLTNIPLLNTVSVNNMAYMFQNCYSLTTIPLLDTSNTTDMNNMFQSCYALTDIPTLNVGKVTNINNIFSSGGSLRKASLRYLNLAYSVSNSQFSSKAINDIINNLPMRASSLALTITGNHGITAAISRSSTLTSGSNVVTTTNTTGYSIGDAVTGNGMSYLASKNMKLNNSNKVFTSVAHGLQNNTPIFSLFNVNFFTTPKTLPSNSNWANAAYGNGLHICITETTGNLAIVSADNGDTFTNYSIPAGTYYNLVFGNGTFVAFRYNSNKAITSVDGQTWVEITLPSSTTWKQACFFDNKFVCISTSGKSVASSDLINWTEGTLPVTYEWRMTQTPTQIFLIRYNNSGTNTVCYSSDGLNWTSQQTVTSFGYGINDITYGNGKYFAITTQPYTFISTDGINWSSGPNINSSPQKIKFINNKFVIVYNSTMLYMMNDVNDTALKTLPTGTWCLPSYDGVNFVFFSKNSSIANKVIMDTTFDISCSQKFYLKNVTTDTFELALTPGGVSIETQGIYTTADFVYKAGSYITDINPNVSITLSAPATVTGTQTLTVRPGLDIMQAAAKNWTITY